MRASIILGIAALALASPAVARADLPDEIKVHVVGDPDLVVERRIDDTELWESVCTGVCDRKLPLGGRYRLVGHGIRHSLWIALVPPEHEALSLDVKAAYSTGWVGGIALVSVGAATMFAATIGLVVGVTQGNNQCLDFGCGEQPNHSVAIAGGVSLLVGALMVAGGVGAIVLGSQTRVRQVATVTVTPRGLAVEF